MRRLFAGMLAVLVSCLMAPSPAQAAAFDIRSVKPTAKAFYPTVQDGYLDTVGFVTSSTSTIVRATWEIYRPNGTLARQYAKASNPGYWRWDGRYNNGALMAPGTYTVKIIGWDSAGRRDYATTKVEIATGWVAKSYRLSKIGNDTRFSHRGACFQDVDGSSAYHDAWDGTCVGSYYFAVPRGAYNFAGGVHGETTANDFDWAGGSISWDTKQTSSTQVRVSIKVTYFRAFRVDSAYLKYTVKVKR